MICKQGVLPDKGEEQDASDDERQGDDEEAHGEDEDSHAGEAEDGHHEGSEDHRHEQSVDNQPENIYCLIAPSYKNSSKFRINLTSIADTINFAILFWNYKQKISARLAVGQPRS